MKEAYAEKKIADHIEKAIKKIYRAEDDADKDVIKLLAAIDKELEAEEKPIEFILFKVDNSLQEIVINAGLKMQKAKNELIENLEKDMGKVAELVSAEEELAVVKDEMDEVSALLDERIEIEKESLEIKAKE